jgi:ubiquinone/menaquinone biosynthesis C-methylase UbiE
MVYQLVMSATTPHKARAVEIHTDQAGLFDDRYRAMVTDPYRSTFTYGRKQIEALIEHEIVGMGPGTRALDVGCGTGFNVRRLSQRQYSVVGIEPSEGMREKAREHNPGIDIRDGDIEELPFADGCFDLVIAIEVVRYLRDPARALAEVARVLAPGGKAIITAAPLLSLSGYALFNVLSSRVNLPWFTKMKQSFMTAASARRAMLVAGFHDVHVHGRFLGGWHAIGKVSPGALSMVLRAFEPLETRLADRWPFRDLSNHLILIGTK